MTRHDEREPGEAGEAGEAGPGRAGPGVSVPPSAWPTGRLLSAAARRVEREWDAYLERWSLTHASLPVLAVLAGGGRFQREIASELGVTEQTISRMLVGLERSGYLQRQRHDTDRRQHVVAITPGGRAALEALNDSVAVERLVAATLTPDQVAQLRGLLVRMLRPDAPGPRAPELRASEGLPNGPGSQAPEG